MKKTVIWMSLCAALVLSGCCSYRETTRTDYGGIRYENGERPIGTIYVENVSYQLFGFIPFQSGSFSTDYESYPSGGIGGPSKWFTDQATLENNVAAINGELQRIGASRVRNLVSQEYESSAWSLFLFNRKTVRTSCTVLANDGEMAGE